MFIRAVSRPVREAGLPWSEAPQEGDLWELRSPKALPFGQIEKL